MFATPGGRSGRTLLILLTLLACAPVTADQRLALPDAERIAVERDAALAALTRRRDALTADAVADAQLPDPELRLGALNLPTDTFAIDQEPMTQLQVGVRQRFPRGATRALSRERTEAMADAEAALGEERSREVRRELRIAWTERAFVAGAQAILRDRQSWFAQLEEATLAAYAAGQGRQHDLLRITMERELLEEESVRLDQLAHAHDAQLSRWLGEAYTMADTATLPVLPPPLSPTQAAEALRRHPLIVAQLDRVRAEEIGVDLAEQAYRPAWALDLAYGFRDGEDERGDERPDFFSAMLSFDLPLFTDRRQDRRVVAADAREAESRSQLEEQHRMLQRRYATAWSDWASLEQRVALYSQRVLPAAESTVEATREAYRNDVAPFDELVRSEKTLLDAQTRLLDLSSERLIAQAELLYLTGGAR
jgi:outer membrane protein TolC